MKKKIRVVHNPEDNPIKFPADVTFLELADGANMDNMVKLWAETEKQILVAWGTVANIKGT
jgi:hypothetical protein